MTFFLEKRGKRVFLLQKKTKERKKPERKRKFDLMTPPLTYYNEKIKRLKPNEEGSALDRTMAHAE